MHKKQIIKQGRIEATNFIPNRTMVKMPVVTDEFTQDGIRFYKDSEGKHHVADTFDRTWGKRDPEAIKLKNKVKFQRTMR